MTPEIENRIACLHNLNFYNPEYCEGKYHMPILKKTAILPRSFNRFSLRHQKSRLQCWRTFFHRRLSL